MVDKADSTDVAAIDTRISAHTSGNVVNLATYSSSNRYKVPKDGYVIAEFGNSDGGWISVNGAFAVKGTTGVFVRQGTQLYVQNITGSPHTYFMPLN